MHYSKTFSFQDTVDILVGWHIDVTQRDSLTEYTSEALISFHQFWSADLSFSVNLLGQFLEDMEAYVEDLVLGVAGSSGPMPVGDAADILPPDECVVKISALLRVFTTVVKSLWDGPSVNNQYLTEILDRLVKCVNAVLSHWFHEATIISGSFYQN